MQNLKIYKDMEREEVKNLVIEVIEEKLGCMFADENSSLKNDLGADSLDNVEICMELENRLEVSVTDEESDKVFSDDATVKKVIDFFHERKCQQS